MGELSQLKDVGALGAAVIAVVALALSLRSVLQMRGALSGINSGRIRDDQRFHDLVAEVVLHKVANIAMGYRPVFEALARGDSREAVIALDRAEDGIRTQQQLVAERLARKG